MCSESVYGPRWLIAPPATRMEMKRDCQKEKKRIPLTQRNLGTGLVESKRVSTIEEFAAHRKGLRSSFTHIQNMAKQYKAKHMLML